MCFRHSFVRKKWNSSPLILLESSAKRSPIDLWDFILFASFSDASNSCTNRAKVAKWDRTSEVVQFLKAEVSQKSKQMQLRRSEGLLMHNRVQFGGLKPGDEVDLGEKWVQYQISSISILVTVLPSLTLFSTQLLLYPIPSSEMIFPAMRIHRLLLWAIAWNGQLPLLLVEIVGGGGCAIE